MMKQRNLMMTAAAVVIFHGVCEAQSGARSALSAYSRTRSSASQILSRPTVSPYLRLLNANNQNNGFGSVQPVYQTQVRPAIENRQQQQMQQRQIQQVQSQLNQIRSANVQRNSGYMPTGHPTRFMSYSHYYPLFGR